MFMGLFLLFGLIYLLSNQVREYMDSSDPVLQNLKGLLQEAFPTDPDIQSIQLYKGGKSYTLNKQKIYLCLKDEHGEYYNLNTLCYVLLHELSHVKNDEIGHGDKFQRIFDNLLKEAKKRGVYDDTIPVVSNYCNY